MAKEKGPEPTGPPRSAGRRREAFPFDDPPELDETAPRPGGDTGEAGGAIPDFIRRAMAFGFSGFFATEEAMRRALGDTVPKDWIDFAAEQSDRTRGDLTERFAQEFGKVLEQVDLVQLMSQLLEGRSIEVNASIRLGPERSGKSGDAPTDAPAKDGRSFHTDLTLSTSDESPQRRGSSDPQERRKPKGP